jgi:hypothetical protein
MANRHGYPIWYELMTKDPAGAQAFYGDVLGWRISDKSDQPGMDYRMIAVAPGEFTGGVFVLGDEDSDGGAFPTWLFYIGVDDVDATAAKIAKLGGAIHLEPFDIPGAGRAAMVSDPQGNPFYIMRGTSDDESKAFDPMGMGRCNWNELATRDHAAGNAFYGEVFGWTWPDKMTMPGDMGDYTFAAAGDVTIGGTMKVQQDDKAGWQFYFRAPDIESAAARVKAGGGLVLQEPMEVPGGDMIIIATDPEGVRFGVVAPGKGERR